MISVVPFVFINDISVGNRALDCCGGCDGGVCYGRTAQHHLLNGEKGKKERGNKNSYRKTISPHPGRFKEKGDITQEREDWTPI